MENDNISNAIFVVDYHNVERDCDNGDILQDLLNVQQVDSGKRKRITSVQLSKLKSFADTHPDFTKGTNKADCIQELAWECLVVELNTIGPPVHTNKEWRTVWSQYKGNKKRKISATKQLEPIVVNKPSLDDITVEPVDVTPDVGVFKGDLKDDKEHSLDKLLRKMVDLEKKIDSSESKIIKSIDELKNMITEKFTSV